MINNKILGLMGFAARARKIAYGADSVENEIKKKKIKLVIISKESSDRSKEKFIRICETYNIPNIIDGTIEELSKAIGKSNKAIIGIEENNIAKEIQKIYGGGESIG